MSTANKLTYLNGTKQAIKQAINEDFEVIDDNTTFREYAEEISSNNAKYKDLIPKETTNATNTLDISNSSGLDKALVTQYGNTYQETTTGKNLLDTKVFENRLINCYVVNSNGTITQTATDTNLWRSSHLPNSIILNSGTYTISVNNRNGSKLQVYNLTTNSNIVEASVDSYTFTLDNDNQVINAKLYGASSYPFTFTMQLEKNSSATSYEKYTGGNPAPNPDYPQNIVNVTGTNTIKIVGKNVFDISKITRGVSYSYGTSGSVPTSSSSNARATLSPNNAIKVQPNTTYTFNHNSTWRISLGQLTSGKVSLGDSGWKTSSAMPLTITTGATCEYVGFNFSKSDNTTITDNDWNEFLNSNLQFEKSPTASDYEPYQEQSFDLDLKSKNLFDEIYPDMNNNLSYKHIFVGDGIFTLSSTVPLNTQKNANLFFLEGKVNSGASTGDNGVRNGLSRSQNSRDGYVTIAYRDINGANPKDYKTQLESGSSVSTYEPYYDINLCKIDTYKDRIYPLNGKWYLEKKIGKVVLDGSESWVRGSSATTRSVFSLNTFTDRKTSDSLSDFVSDKFSFLGNAQSTDLGYAMSFNTGDYSNYLYIQVPTNIVSSGDIVSFKTWLSTHNVDVYYILATPTTEEITESNYPTLYNQLNNIKLFEGVNHITMTNESGLDVEFDIEYYKDWKLD